jgi:deoxyadenosine/deoxycytidine kinase
MNPIIISVEGCIGAGKTTFLKELEKAGYCVVYEPVDEWTKESIQCEGGESKSMFELYYEDKCKYGFAFQMYVLQSRVHHFIRAIQDNPGKVIITERCPLTDHKVFAEMMYEQGIIDQYSYKVYKKWFDLMTTTVLPKVSALVYLRVNPEVCVQRILKRNRNGESRIDLNYLNCLQTKHEEWLMLSSSDVPIKVIDGNGTVPSPEVIADFVRSATV